MLSDDVTQDTYAKPTGGIQVQLPEHSYIFSTTNFQLEDGY